MKYPNLPQVLHVLFSLLLATAALAADRIEMADGSIINGKILSAEAGKFKVETAFAGTIEIAQDKVKSFTTDEAVNVGLAGGTTVQGKVEQTDTGISIAAPTGQATAATDKVTALWRTGADSPEVRHLKEAAAKAERKWAYEAGAAISGRTGVTEKFDAIIGLKATLESDHDKLIFDYSTERGEDNGTVTANRQMGSVDYSAFPSAMNGWYVRTSVEKDELKDLDLRSSSAFGFARKIIKKDNEDLEVRVGLNYLYESYTTGGTFESPGLDLTMLYSRQFANSKLTDTLTYSPTFKDSSNYRINHEFGYEMPIAASQWKLKLGMLNEYLGVPQPGNPNLDTTYFTSLILNWK